MPKKRKVWKSEQKLGADLLWALPRAGCRSWADHPPSLPCLKWHGVSNAAELAPVSQERCEDEWLRSPLNRCGVILGLEWAMGTGPPSIGYCAKPSRETETLSVYALGTFPVEP